LPANVNIRKNLFNGLDIESIKDIPDFKEDSVREIIISPILKELGYNHENIVRSKTLEHPFLKVGSKKRKIKQFPDYSLKVENSFAWVLDAKEPNESIISYDNTEQVYSYAAHPEIRSVYYALCNGLEFSLFRTGQSGEPILYFRISEIDYYWDKLKFYLSPQSFQIGKIIGYETTNATSKPIGFDYKNRPLLEEIPVKKQQAKRHFGVHGYFTKQAWNIVADYIKNFTKPGDLVLDPFGGSGVTAIEALMTNRRAISIDINPMVVFIVNALIAPTNPQKLAEAFERVKNEYLLQEPKTDKEISNALKIYPYPHDVKLPEGSDVDTIEQLFSKKQLAQLALLKHLIIREKDINIKNSLMLMFSGLITKVNLTYHTTPKKPRAGQGDAAAFRYYRYRIAPFPVDVDVMFYFSLRYKKIKEAKRELSLVINEKIIPNSKIIKGTATNLKWIPKESVDYIYTDPPYGKKIPYLDLSIMWNEWLDLEVTKEDYDQEAIVGGEQKKSKNDYNGLIAQSIKEMYRVLKFDRWLSFVFAHKDPEFWHLIIDTAENCGFEYIGAVPQKNGQTSFKKRQHPFTVLSGQLIINFKKVKNPKAIMKAHLGMNITEIIIQTIEGIIAKNDGATLEQINDELIIKGLELGFLDLLKKEYSDLTGLLLTEFVYSPETEQFTIPEKGKFKTHLDIQLRIRYYLKSMMVRAERQGKYLTLDELVLSVLPLLKNGTTPEKQTILKVLEDIGEHIGQEQWKLKKGGQQELF
jgi:DNA modification methylase